MTSPIPTSVFVSRGDDALRALLAPALTTAQQGRVQSALSGGRAVVFTRRSVTGDHVVVHLGQRRLQVPAVFVAVGGRTVPSEMVVPPSVGHHFAMPSTTVGLVLSGTPLTPAQEGDLRQVLSGLDRASDGEVAGGGESARPSR